VVHCFGARRENFWSAPEKRQSIVMIAEMNATIAAVLCHSVAQKLRTAR
jgi:hypothetical protein